MNSRGCSTLIESYGTIEGPYMRFQHTLPSLHHTNIWMKHQTPDMACDALVDPKLFREFVFCLSACILASSRSPVWQQHKGGSTDARCSICIMKPGLMQQQLPLVRPLHPVYSKINQHPSHIQSWGAIAIVYNYNLFFLFNEGPISIFDSSWVEICHHQGTVF